MTNDIDAHIGKKIRQSRILKGMTQQELGDAVGVQFQQIQKYEIGANRVSGGRLWNMAATLGVPVSTFFDGLRTVTGMAESQTDYVQLLSSRESLELIRELYGVDKKIRRHLISLIRQVGKVHPSDDDDSSFSSSAL